MRVLHVMHTSMPFICGYSIRSDYILRYQRRQGVDNAVVTSAQHPNGELLDEELDGTRYWRTSADVAGTPSGLRELKLMAALRRRLDTAIEVWKPDVIHAHSPMLVGLPAISAGRKRRIPVIYEIRDLWENASVDRGKFAVGSPQYRLAHCLETRVLTRAAAVVTICDRLREALQPRVGGGKDVFVVPNGVDTGSFQPEADDLETRHRWNLLGKRVIGYIGTFQPYEGLLTLIAAMPAVVSRVPTAHLVITGSGGEEARLREAVSTAKLESHVTFTGRVPHDQVKSIYRIAELMVYPRTLTRTTALTTPLKPLEAMAMGKPVLVSDVPAMHELVQPGTTGATFRAGDADHLAKRCAEMLANPAELRRMGTEAHGWVQRERQWPDLVAKYTPIYAGVLS